jgi:flagellar basal body rod protein FlgG
MKKNVFFPATVFSVVLFSLIAAGAQTSKRKSTSSGSASALNGAWQRVYHYNGKTTITGEPKEFAVIHDGFFSSIGHDTEGRWTNTHGGSFELNGNVMKNHLLYSSHTDRLGFTTWVEYDLEGDTLTLKFNSKKMVTPQGQEITVEMPTSESKFIRAKR